MMNKEKFTHEKKGYDMSQKPIDILELDPRPKDRIARLANADELIIMENDRPIARIVPIDGPKPVFGGCRGMLRVIDEDDEHLAHLEESFAKPTHWDCN